MLLSASTPGPTGTKRFVNGLSSWRRQCPSSVEGRAHRYLDVRVPTERASSHWIQCFTTWPSRPKIAVRMATPSSGRPLNALVIESDPDYAVSVRAIAEAASLGVTVTAEPEEGLRLLASERFDLVVLAVREQDDVAALVGEIHDTSPSGVVILDEALGIAREAYDSGADQVLPKPFVPGHLAGAIRAALRTRGPESIVAVATTIRVGDVEFNSDRREVRWDDHFRVRFSAREWELLSVLLAHTNRFFTAQELRGLAWDDDQLGLDQVRGYIYRLRRKLEAHPLPCRLVTSRGLGYCLRVSPTAVTAALPGALGQWRVEHHH
jgi:DNA-binding response OmpR family regulator